MAKRPQTLRELLIGTLGDQAPRRRRTIVQMELKIFADQRDYMTLRGMERQRMNGGRIDVSSLVREILDDWIKAQE